VDEIWRGTLVFLITTGHAGRSPTMGGSTRALA
jgi:hypothetical protein